MKMLNKEGPIGDGVPVHERSWGCEPNQEIDGESDDCSELQVQKDHMHLGSLGLENVANELDSLFSFGLLGVVLGCHLGVWKDEVAPFGVEEETLEKNVRLKDEE